MNLVLDYSWIHTTRAKAVLMGYASNGLGATLSDSAVGLGMSLRTPWRVTTPIPPGVPICRKSGLGRVCPFLAGRGRFFRARTIPSSRCSKRRNVLGAACPLSRFILRCLLEFGVGYAFPPIDTSVRKALGDQARGPQEGGSKRYSAGEYW